MYSNCGDKPRKYLHLQKRSTSIRPIGINVVGNWTRMIRFVTMKKVSRKYIPRGCRIEYITGLDSGSKPLLDRYQKLYSDDPFSEDAVQAGEDVLQEIPAPRTEKWCELITDLNMKQNSRYAWKLIKNLSNYPSAEIPDWNQISHCFLLIGKSSFTTEKIKILHDIYS